MAASVDEKRSASGLEPDGLEAGGAARPPPRPYLPALAAAIGSALVAALVVGGADVLLTLSGAGDTGGSGASFAAITLALYAGAALVVGLVEGLVAGAVRATHPRGTVRRLLGHLGRDPEDDRRVAGGLLAGGAAAGLYAVTVAVVALQLVGETQRKAVGALLLGGVAAAALVGFALLWYPFYRVGRRLAWVFPRVGGVPRTVLLAAIVATGGALVAGAFIARSLDWRVLPLAAPITAFAFAAVQLVWLGLRHGPLAGVVDRLPGRALLALGVVVALAGSLWAVRGATPDERTVALLNGESRGAKSLAAVARRAFDRDGDGYASVLGGGDCDDRQPTVHPGATDAPDDGVDQNCLGGDARKLAAAAPAAKPAAPAPASPPDSAAGKLRFDGNVLVITVDTLRADRLGMAGYTRRGGKSLTPNMDALAARGVYFRRAYAQAPNTPRSFPSWFTSRYPSQVRWETSFQNYPKVLPENVSIFEVLRDAGFHTAGIASHFYFTPERGILQGFVEFDNEGAKTIKESNRDIASPRTVPKVIEKLKALGESGKRFVLFTHLFEPHSTYLEHPEYPISSRGVEGLEEKYDYEIAYVDRWVGELLAGLKAAGRDQDTMVILMSDHGEAFGAHRFGGQRLFFHGQTLYDELLLVPLIVAIPGIAPRVVDQPVELTDVAPTLLDALKVPAPDTFVGRSLLPAIAGDPLPPRPVHGELLPAPSWNHDAKMMIDGDGRSKIVYRISDNTFELFDLAEDPTEQKNLWSSRKELASRMKAALTAWMETGL